MNLLKLIIMLKSPILCVNSLMTDEEIRIYLGMFILMNIVFIMSITFTTIRCRKENEHKKYIKHLFLGNDFVLFAMFNIVAIVIDGLFVFMYLGYLIGQML